jgi:hypothetical protein
MPCFRLLGVMTLLLSFSVPSGRAQSGRIPAPRIPDEHTEMELEMQRKVQKQRMKKRFEDVKRDSQKLLDLATELKKDVDKAGENVLSMDVLRKAEEMEKLARQVKNNMRSE